MWKHSQQKHSRRRMVGVFAGMALVTVAFVGFSHGQTVAPSQSIRPPSPSGSQQPQTPSPYTTRLNCPDGAKLSADIPDKIRPPGWEASYASGHLVLGAVQIGSWQGKQELQCQYNTQSAPGGHVASLRHFVESNSCIVAPDKKSFLCKPGVK